MKHIFIALAAVVMSLVLTIGEAEAAKRIGGGRSVGTQRDTVTNRQATPPAAAPAAPTATNPAAAQPRTGMSRWLGPLAGLAAGLGLAYLFGDHLGGIMMGLLIVLAVVIGFAMLMRMLGRRNGPQPAAAGAGAAGNATFNGLGREPYQAPRAPSSLPVSAAAPAASSVPANFDTAGFLASAKQAFLSLQSANDRGDLEALREMTTDDMFATIKREIESRGNASQAVEVVTLNADLIEATTERDLHWASVRFSGALREEGAGVPEKFEEVWNLQKPAAGAGGWVLAGIQQLN